MHASLNKGDVKSPETAGRRPARWKTVVLGVLVVLAVTAILEGGARMVVRRQAWRQGLSGDDAEAPLKVHHDLSDLDKVHVADPYAWGKMAPNLVRYRVVGRCWNRDVDFTISTEEHGLRNPPLAPEGARTRILAIGDSTTFGLGVNNEDTWPAQLEKILNEAAGGERFEVLNAGMSGYSAFQGLRYLDKHGLYFRPALVTACFGHNDFATWNSKTDVERAVEHAAIVEEVAEKSRSDLFVLARRALEQAEHAVEGLTGEKRPRLTPEEFHDTLIEIKKVCDAQGIPLLFILWPYEWQVRQRKPERVRYQPILIETCEEMGATLINLYDAFVEATEPLYLDPVHGNSAGCRAAAEAIAAAVGRTLNTEGE